MLVAELQSMQKNVSIVNLSPLPSPNSGGQPSLPTKELIDKLPYFERVRVTSWDYEGLGHFAKILPHRHECDASFVIRA